MFPVGTGKTASLAPAACLAGLTVLTRSVSNKASRHLRMAGRVGFLPGSPDSDDEDGGNWGVGGGGGVRDQQKGY